MYFQLLKTDRAHLWLLKKGRVHFWLLNKGQGVSPCRKHKTWTLHIFTAIKIKLIFKKKNFGDRIKKKNFGDKCQCIYFTTEVLCPQVSLLNFCIIPDSITLLINIFKHIHFINCIFGKKCCTCNIQHREKINKNVL